MAASKYTIAPPSIAPLLLEFGDYDAIPEAAWREFIAATTYWARTWLMYAGPADEPPKPKRTRRREAGEKDAPATEGLDASTPRMAPVVNGGACAGFLLNLGQRGVEAFDKDENSLGVFPDAPSAATAVRSSVVPASPPVEDHTA